MREISENKVRLWQTVYYVLPSHPAQPFQLFETLEEVLLTVQRKYRSIFHQACLGLQSWTKILTHLRKTNAFYRSSCVTEKHLFVDSRPPLSSFSMLKYAPWTLLRGCNIKKGRGGRNLKIREKLTRSTKQIFFFGGGRGGGECLNYFCP